MPASRCRCNEGAGAASNRPAPHRTAPAAGLSLLRRSTDRPPPRRPPPTAAASGNVVRVRPAGVAVHEFVAVIEHVWVGHFLIAGCDLDGGAVFLARADATARAGSAGRSPAALSSSRNMPGAWNFAQARRVIGIGPCGSQYQRKFGIAEPAAFLRTWRRCRLGEPRPARPATPQWPRRATPAIGRRPAQA